MQTSEFHIRNAQDLGAAIKHFRNTTGLTQAELAARAGVHRTYLSGLERGHVTEGMVHVMDLFNELGIRVSVAQERP